MRTTTRNTPLQRVKLGAVVLAIIVLGATCAYRMLGRTWLDSLYMVVITIATVGYGERSQVGPTEQAVTIAVILLGISASVFTLGGFLQMMTEGEIQRALSLGRTTRAIEHLENHVIICGFGRMGQILAEQLQKRKRPLVVIDSAAGEVADAQAQGHLVLAGDAMEEDVLQEARIAHARCLVTVLPSDAANVFITLTSRNLNPKLQIIARGELASTQKKLLQAGANRVVLPATIGALRIASMITHPATVELMEFVSGESTLNVEVDELEIPPTSPLVGKTIEQVQPRRKYGLLVVASRGHEGQVVFNPDPDMPLEANAILVVLGRVEDIERFRRDYQL